MRFIPGSGAAARGLVPDQSLSADPFFDDRELMTARVAAFTGDWHPAADLVAAAAGDWDRRTTVVRTLAAMVPEERSWLQAWTEERPDDPDLAVMRAEALVAMAWQRRGSASARYTTRQQAVPFFQLLEYAEAAAWQAAELAPADPTPCVSMISIAMGLNKRFAEFDGIWNGLTVRAPLHRPGHNRALQYWCAKWHGSEERMLRFAVSAAAKSPVLSPLPLIAAFEMALGGTPTWRAGYVQRGLEEALPWLNGEGAQHPCTREDRAYAILALMHNSRYDDAVKQFRHLGAHAEGHVWNFDTDVRKGAKPVEQFAALRAKACRRASKDS